jgi:hypothetical protein
MQVTLFGGLVTAAMDPLLIFGAGLGTDGARDRNRDLAHRLHRRRHDGHRARAQTAAMATPFAHAPRCAGLFRYRCPAILTNVATPVGGLLYMRILAPFGAEAIAANAILDRLVPLAFGALFALSGAIGPILGRTLVPGCSVASGRRCAMPSFFAGLYSLVVWVVLIVLRNQVAAVFSVDGATARYVAFFCLVGGLAWVFIGACARFERGLQQPRLSALFHRLQLGPRDIGHRAACLARRFLGGGRRRDGRACRRQLYLRCERGLGGFPGHCRA